MSGSVLYYATPSGGVLGRAVLGTDAIMNGQRSRTDENGQLAATSLSPGLYQVLALFREGLVSVGQVMVPFYGEATLHLPAQDSDP